MFEKVFEINRDIDLFYSDYRPLNIESFKTKRFLHLLVLEVLKISLSY